MYWERNRFLVHYPGMVLFTVSPVPPVKFLPLLRNIFVEMLLNPWDANCRTPYTALCRSSVVCTSRPVWNPFWLPWCVGETINEFATDHVSVTHSTQWPSDPKCVVCYSCMFTRTLFCWLTDLAVCMGDHCWLLVLLYPFIGHDPVN